MKAAIFLLDLMAKRGDISSNDYPERIPEMKKVIAVLFTVALLSSAQPMKNIQPARPSDGWDVLKSKIVYPEIARRAGVEGISNVAVKVDSSGNVVDIIISGYPIFNGPIEDAVKKVLWTPEREGMKAHSSSVFFDVRFQFRSTNAAERKVLVIEAEKPGVEKSSTN